MNLDAYELTGQHAYAELARRIARIIETIAQQKTDFRIQQVQHRAKGVGSLRRKLEQREVTDSQDIEGEVKDLAGCRVILYTNADVIRFIQSGLIGESFDVDWDRTKFHYPMQEPTAEDGFISYNYVVRLKEDRAALPEYARLAGLACEVQVQTTLDHAWSEMAHDTIYKPPPAGFGGSVMQGITERMTKIIQDHLRPAGFDFQKIVTDVRHLERGRALLERDPLRLIAEAGDNNERYQLLDEYEDYVLPYYDNIEAISAQVRRIAVSAAKKARRTPQTPWLVHGMSLEGHGAERVVARALDIVDQLRFASRSSVRATFRAICDLFPGTPAHEQNRLRTSLERLAKHDLRIWNVAGPAVQVEVVKLIREMPEKRRATVRPLLIKTLSHELDPDVEGSTSNYNSITLHMGGVVASDAYLTVRRDALTILEELFAVSASEVEQREILNAFATANRLPYHTDPTAALVEATIADGTRVVRFMEALSGTIPYEVLQAYEHDVLWLFRRNAELPPAFRANTSLQTKQKELREAILSFRDAINGDQEFVIYKTLVGFESVFPGAWANDEFDVQADDAYRAGEIKRLAASVDEATFDRWLSRIRRVAQTKSNDLATFPSFGTFLVELGRAKPNLLLRVFDHLDDDLAWFVGSMLQGLEGGEAAGKALERARTWIADGRHLVQIFSYCDASEGFDPALLESAMLAAIRADEGRAVAAGMGVCVGRHEAAKEHAEATFARGLAYFAKKQETYWVNTVWFRLLNNAFLSDLPAHVRREIIKNLVDAPAVDTHVEWVLDAVADEAPLNLVPFFHARLRRERVAGSRYEAIPYEFDRLQEAFAPVAAEFVAVVRGWFEEGDAFFEHLDGALIPRLYPSVAVVLPPLREMALNGTERDVQFVLTILRGYEGDPEILGLARDVVARLDLGSPLVKQVEFALDQSGMVRGEFGFVELHQAQKAQMDTWLSDTEPKVRAFAQDRVRSLDLQIKSEQRRAKEDLELRKRTYGE